MLCAPSKSLPTIAYLKNFMSDKSEFNCIRHLSTFNGLYNPSNASRFAKQNSEEKISSKSLNSKESQQKISTPLIKDIVKKSSQNIAVDDQESNIISGNAPNQLSWSNGESSGKFLKGEVSIKLLKCCNNFPRIVFIR